MLGNGGYQDVCCAGMIGMDRIHGERMTGFYVPGLIAGFTDPRVNNGWGDGMLVTYLCQSYKGLMYECPCGFRRDVSLFVDVEANRLYAPDDFMNPVEWIQTVKCRCQRVIATCLSRLRGGAIRL